MRSEKSKKFANFSPDLQGLKGQQGSELKNTKIKSCQHGSIFRDIVTEWRLKVITDLIFW